MKENKIKPITPRLPRWSIVPKWLAILSIIAVSIGTIAGAFVASAGSNVFVMTTGMLAWVLTYVVPLILLIERVAE